MIYAKNRVGEAAVGGGWRHTHPPKEEAAVRMDGVGPLCRQHRTEASVHTSGKAARASTKQLLTREFQSL